MPHQKVNSAILCLAAVCWLSGSALAQLNEKMQMQLLEAHNKVRSSVSPPAKIMFKLVTIEYCIVSIFCIANLYCKPVRHGQD